MGKFKVGDLVVIARPILGSQERYRGFVRKVFKVDEHDDGCYYFEDIQTKDGSELCGWRESELDLVENITETNNLRMITTSNGIKVELRNEQDKCDISVKPCIESTVYESYCMEDIAITSKYCEKNKEEKEMNKVLNLWYDRKKKAIKKRYDNLREEFNEPYSSIQRFNELVDKFNKDLEELYNYDKATEQFVLTENALSNVIKYKVDTNRIDDCFNKMYREKIKQDFQEIDDIKEEVEAQLSLSNDLEYQRKILKKYGIINKVTEKISE